MRRERSRGRRAAYSRVKADLPPGQSFRRLMEFAASAMMKSAQTDTAGARTTRSSIRPMMTRCSPTTAPRPPTADQRALLMFIVLRDRRAGRRAVADRLRPARRRVARAGLGRSVRPVAHLHAGIPSVGLGSGQRRRPTWRSSPRSAPCCSARRGWLWTSSCWAACRSRECPRCWRSGGSPRRGSSGCGRPSYALLPWPRARSPAGRFGTAVVFMLLPLIALLAGRC